MEIFLEVARFLDFANFARVYSKIRGKPPLCEPVLK